jgi:hypothetical protein
MYRILQRVDKGGPVGSLCAFDWLNEQQIGRLIQVGAIAPVALPPLDVLPGWTRRAKRLAAVGIKGTDGLLEANIEELAAGLGLKPETVNRWKEEVMRLLTIPSAVSR